MKYRWLSANRIVALGFVGAILTGMALLKLSVGSRNIPLARRPLRVDERDRDTTLKEDDSLVVWGRSDELDRFRLRGKGWPSREREGGRMG